MKLDKILEEKPLEEEIERCIALHMAVLHDDILAGNLNALQMVHYELFGRYHLPKLSDLPEVYIADLSQGNYD